MTNCSKNLDPNKILLDAYSVFASSNDPEMRALYNSYLEREIIRKKELISAWTKKLALRKEKNRILNSILTDFYSGRFWNKKEHKTN